MYQILNEVKNLYNILSKTIVYDFALMIQKENIRPN